VFQVEKTHLNFIPELIDILVETIVYVYHALDVNKFLCFLSLNITLPVLTKRIIMQILSVRVTDRCDSAVYNLLQLLNKDFLTGRKPHLPILFMNLDVDPCVIVEGLLAVTEE
jgi:hypothetical protein